MSELSSSEIPEGTSTGLAVLEAVAAGVGAVVLDGKPLHFTAIRRLSTGADAVVIDEGALAAVAAARAAFEEALASGAIVYGANTGVGAMKDWTPSPQDLARFNADLVIAHSFGVGTPLPVTVTRLAMAIRANTMLAGHTGSTPGLVRQLVAWLNAGLTPLLRPIGSLGTGDIGLMGQVGAALAGEGEAMLAGVRLPASEAIARAGLTIHECGVKDSLAALSSNAAGVALAASAIGRAAGTLRTLMATGLAAASAAGSLPAPALAATVLGTPRQAEIGRWLDTARTESAIPPGDRIHDPLSLRMMPQVFAAAIDAVEAAGRVAVADTARNDDNPVLIGGTILSSGGSMPLDLTLAIEGAALALAHLARNAMNRCILLVNGRLVNLPVNLVAPGATMTGFGPVLKLAGELFARVRHLTMPVSTEPVVVADGLEDEATFLPLAVENLSRALDALDLLAALEALIAAAALDVAGLRPEGLAGRVYTAVRRLAAPHDRDRQLSQEIEAIAADLASPARIAEFGKTSPLPDFDGFFAIFDSA
ncbi:aromatic amino acid lyase [Pleomorphomonas sp. PLEO]|uniref:aromatic amino acid lyase n=1 Tax=Pleomorphomonas sp. PLEO TaxID=3239306 RepID=UPI00351E3B36